MAMQARRDRSVQNVPVVGWQDSADAQDVILFGIVRFTEQVATDGFGVATASRKPFLDATHDWVVDSNGVPRERKIDGADVQATRVSDSTALYVGQVDAVNGKVTIYADAGLTTAAANTQVSLSYWAAVPVALGPDGRLQVALPTSQAGNLSTAIAEPLPPGTNTIGSINLASALPTGQNVIGKVIIRNTADGGGEDNSVRIRDSVGGNTLAAMAYNADSKTVPSFPLSVSDLPWLYNGDGTASRVRNSRYFKAATATAQGATTVWTPAAGKTVALRGFLLVADNTVTVQFAVAGTPIDPKIPLVAGHAVSVVLPNIWIPGAAGQALGISLSAAATVGVILFGTEE